MDDSYNSEEIEEDSLLKRVAELELQLAKLEVEEEKKISPAQPGRHVLHRLIASKVVEGYQIEVIVGGESHFGFPIGLDGEWLQLYCTGTSGHESPPINSYMIERPWRKWFQLIQIEHFQENFFGVKHLTRDSRERLENERKGILRHSKAFLYGLDNRRRA